MKKTKKAPARKKTATKSDAMPGPKSDAKLGTKSDAKPESKSAATRRHLLETALALFQKHGVEATTMRDIADAAGMSLGAAYYYFPSKESLVFAFYEANQEEVEHLELTGSLRDQLGTLLHAKLRSIRDQRHMLGTILPRLVDPGDPLSAFSAQTRQVRARAIEVFATPLREAGMPDEVVRVAAHALWMAQLGAMLVFLNDTSAGQKRTHGLVDEMLDMVVPLLPMLASPMGEQLVGRIVGALDRAGIAMV